MMAGHVDVLVQVAAPLEVTWRIANEAESGTPALDGRHSPGHDVISWEPERNRITYHITTAPDSGGRTWSYYVERTTDPVNKTAYARRWGNENFTYSYAFWQYTGSGSGSQIRCVCDFEMAPGSPMSDSEMQAFMTRGTRAAMEAAARAAATAAQPAIGLSATGGEST
jgi:aromatase